MRATAATAIAPITPINAVPIRLRAPARNPPTRPAMAPTAPITASPAKAGLANMSTGYPGTFGPEWLASGSRGLW